MMVEQHEEARTRSVLDELYATESSALPEGAMEAQVRVLGEWAEE